VPAVPEGAQGAQAEPVTAARSAPGPAGTGPRQLRRASDRPALARTGILPLLDAVARDALDPSYAAAAHRRRGTDEHPPAPPVRLRHRAAGPLALAACGLVVGVVVAGQRAQAPAAQRARVGLASDAQARTHETDALARQLAAAQAEVAARQAAALRAGADPGLAALAARTARLAGATAQSALVGPGAVVVFADAPTGARGAGAGSRPTGTAATGQVLDRQVQDAVNALWAGGAEAVAVGPERLSPLSAIRTAGQTLLVDYRPLSSPYEIRAIGPPNLRASFDASPAAGRLRAAAAADGISVQTQAAAHLELPAATVPALREARP